jgi:hypothetical protein
MVATAVCISEVGSKWSYLFISLISALFVTLLVLVSHVKAIVPLLMVASITLIFPISVLFIIDSGSYPSIWSQTKFILSELFLSNQSKELGLFAPLIVSWLTSLAISKYAKPKLH